MRETYSYYPGCTSHSTAAEYIEACGEVLAALDIDIQELPDWCCCGAASAHNLSKSLAIGLSAFNIAEAQREKADLLIPCAGCYNNLCRADYALRNDGRQRERLEEALGFSYSGEVRMVSIVDLLSREDLRPVIRKRVEKPLSGLKVVCYYGCMLVRPAEITGVDDPENPMRMDRLMADLGAEVIDWPCKVDCCGGDLGMSHGKKTKELVGAIVDYAIAAGADCLVTSCALCQVNVDSRQNRIPIVFFTEMMAEAFQIGSRKRWWKKHINDPSRLFREL